MAVGQVFFHSGSVAAMEPPFERSAAAGVSYVYDCGTLSGHHLIERDVRELKRRRNGSSGHLGRPDVAFILHFDVDHVSGIDHLDRELSPCRYVIPTVSAVKRLHLAAQFLAARDEMRLPDEYAALLADPTAWFAGLSSRPAVIEVLLAPPFEAGADQAPKSPRTYPSDDEPSERDPESPLESRLASAGGIASGAVVGQVEADAGEMASGVASGGEGDSLDLGGVRHAGWRLTPRGV
ncbi:hypothetical protein [Cellulomonas citrea]|uniref:hypothetical protein n=1 Tax=Cellulomonas citrea TaxID=1909423 RepID=UPI00135CA13A|nr:hypothetical protein [Cellulomonas citrea]